MISGRIPYLKATDGSFYKRADLPSQTHNPHRWGRERESRRGGRERKKNDATYSHKNRRKKSESCGRDGCQEIAAIVLTLLACSRARKLKTFIPLFPFPFLWVRGRGGGRNNSNRFPKRFPSSSSSSFPIRFRGILRERKRRGERGGKDCAALGVQNIKTFPETSDFLRGKKAFSSFAIDHWG